MKRLIIAAALAVAFATPASATHFSIINGVCFNPAGNIIPLAAALANPHCGFNAYNPPSPDYPKTPRPDTSQSVPWIVPCIIAGAGGIVLLAIYVGQTQNRELTQAEAMGTGLTCGLGGLWFAAQPRPQPRPVVVRLK